MKTRVFLLILTLSLFVSLHATGQVVFYADFEPGFLRTQYLTPV